MKINQLENLLTNLPICKLRTFLEWMLIPVFPLFMKSIPTKQDLRLDVVELELAAEMVEKEEEEKQRLQVVNRTLSGLCLSDEESRYKYHRSVWVWILLYGVWRYVWSSVRCSNVLDSVFH